MPSDYVSSVAQDLEGYLWLGTAAGLSRFDGFQFVTWRADDSPELQNLGVLGLCAAHDGSLWISFSGASRVSRVRQGKLTSYGPADGLPEGSVQVVFEDRTGAIWAGGHGGLSQFIDGQWHRHPTESGSHEPTVEAIFEDKSGALWFGTSAGVFRRSPGADRLQRLDDSSSTPVRGFIEDDSGGIWSTDASRGLRRWNDGRTTPPLWTGSSLGSVRLLRDRKQLLWIGTGDQGVFRTAWPDKAATERLRERDGLAGDNVLCLFEDREGNLWVGTPQGLSRVSEAKISPALPVDEQRPRENVAAIATAPDGSVWIGTTRGLKRFQHGSWTDFAEQSALPSGTVSALHVDEGGNLWIATTRGLTTYSRGRFTEVPVSPPVQFGHISALATDADGALWISDYNKGLFLWKNGRVNAFELPGALQSVPGMAAIADSRGSVWMGYGDGTAGRFGGGQMQIFSRAEGIAAGRVHGITEDDAHRIWLATDRGLSRFDGKRFQSVTEANGLPNGRLFWVMSDRMRDLWLWYTSGVVRLHPSEFDRALDDPGYRIHYTSYDASDGLRGTPVQRGFPNVARASDGLLWFVTSSGAFVIDPAQVTNKRDAPVARIESVVTNEHRLPPAENLRLAPQVAKFEIEYTALNLTAPQKLRFRYRLEGVDADWVDNGSSRRAVYGHLAPGTYRFLVTAHAGDHVWHEPPTALVFSIQPTYYERRSFYFMCALAIGLLLWFSWRLRMRQVRREFSLVLAERARVAREVHDTLLQSLVGTGLQLDNVANDLGPPHVVKEELTQIRRQVEYYIGEAQQSILDLRSSSGRTRDLASALRATGERVTNGMHVEFCFQMFGTPQPCSARAQQQLNRIVHEAISNAVRHGNASQIRLDLTYDGDSVRVRVTDNGRGFSPDALPVEPDRWGLVGMRERAEHSGGALTITSSPGCGTIIEAELPLAI